MTLWSGLTRWRDWAQSKLPFAGAAALLLGLSPLDTLLVLATIGICAAFGYGVNEIADVEPDALAGKRNHAQPLPRLQRLAFLGGTAAAALASSLLWSSGPATPALLAAGLVLAVAYSSRPTRLKERGLVGVVSAAAAQWTLPVLAIASAGPLHARGALAALLSLTLGIRWMLVHQLHDVAADRTAGVRTFATGSDSLPRMLDGVFALEVAVLAALLGTSWPDSALPVAALAAWILLVELARPVRVRLTGYEAAPLAPYYFAVFPLALGAASSTPAGLLVGVLIAALGSPTLAGIVRATLVRPTAARS